METTYVPMNRELDIEEVVHTYYGTLLDYNKK